MKRQLFLIAVLLLSAAAFAQNSEEAITADGNTVKDKRTINAYSSLCINGPFEVLVTDSSDSFVTLEGSKNIVALIEISEENGTLSIQLPKDRKFKAHRKNKVYIKIPYSTALNTIKFNGSGGLVCRKTIKNNIKVQLEGSGNIKLNLYSAQSDASVLGSGSITLTGAVQDFKCKIIGSGNIQAEKLETANLDVAVTGSGNAYLACTKTIKGNISGSGNVAFTGEPEKQDLKRSGTGDYSAY
ncbi:head GIN domain-containing protein [Flavobacterium sp. DG1-102-2]|uniref:head GIN domain-containing protein n=1 Tax=Flavobacterium sp. DG1-102-2 TaxID=3081663 RepID=UPI002949FBBE|nr:head GIN domain-containing protein [Flavobacterium sp. DG1-102-2]MDV6168525.1 head GIN domain-containing protein [Flavobacterium sp. DG1-102-2]